MCATCAYDGQCDDLRYCGGSCYAPRFAECAKCRRTIDMESGEYERIDDDRILCERCGEAYEDEDDDADEAEGGEE